MIFSGLGVNYRGAQANWAADKAYFKSIKNPNSKFPLRILTQTKVPIPWALGTPDQSGSGNFDYWRECALYFAADPDFDVIFNVYYGPTAARDWTNISTAILAEAAYLQSLGVSLELSLGNELEGTYGIAFAGTSLSQTAGVATLVVASNFNVQVGDTITIYGSNRTQYNTSHVITAIIDSKTVQFNIDSGTPNPGGGTYYAISLSIADLNTNLRNLATSVKAAYPLGKVSYGCFNTTVNGVTSFSDWQTNGIGGLDYLSIHIYPGLKSSRFMQPYGNGFLTAVSLLSALGSGCYVSEFNISSSPLTATTQVQDQINGMKELYKNLRNTGVARMLVWAWDGLLDANNQFAMKNTNGTFSPMWNVLLYDNKRLPVSRSAAPARSQAPSRTTVNRTLV